MRTIEGALSAAGLRIAVVVSRFNRLITERLLEGALEAVRRHGGSTDAVEVVWVPGSMEIPLAAKVAAGSGRFDAVIALGAVIRGDTPHFDHVASQAAAGISRVSIDTGVPCVFGVLTTDTTEQALDRAGVKSGNKGFDAACAAMEMVGVLRALGGPA